MQHELKLQPEYFEAIKSGKKRIECRLYDEKRRAIQLGDTIVFLKNPELQEKITVSVTGLLRYQTFEALLNDFPVEIFGANDRQGLEQALQAFYTPEDQMKFGVLGIRFDVATL
jgi:ASC-1-like (ASCH) protein